MPLTYASRSIVLALFLLIASALEAQFNFQQLQNIPFSKNGKTYATPWLGGFNNPVITSGDLDNDGIDDLAILEKSEGKVYTFKNGGTPGEVDYTYAPELATGFPEDLSTFITLKDFNCDGIPDLFTYSTIMPGHIAVFAGRYQSNLLHFDLYISGLRDSQGNQVYADPTKLPAFEDINGDGDLDIVLFEQPEGTMGYYENRNSERGDCDTLVFVKKTNCWGRFCECSPRGELVKYTFDNAPDYFEAETMELVRAEAIVNAPTITDEGIVFSSECNSLAWNTSGYPQDTSYEENKYVEFTAGSESSDYSLYISSATFRVSNGDTCDPVNLELRSSADGYTNALGGRKVLAAGCNSPVKFHLLNDPFFYKLDSVTFRLYAFKAGNCSPANADLIVDRIALDGQINRKGSFDIILDYSHSFCFFDYFKGGGGNHESGPDTIPGTRHSGSTVTVLDFNRDGWSDVLVGDAGFDNLVLMINQGSTDDTDSMTGIDYAFPSYDESIHLPVFPAAYYLDVNNDNKKDLLIAPFQRNSCSYNSLNDFALNKQNIWFYENTGVNQDSFELVTKEFLVDEMVDFGDRPHAVFYDYDRDGLQDLIIGQCHGYGADKKIDQGLILYRNTGTRSSPAFAWVTDDFAYLEQYDWYGLRPTFGDLNGDGYEDMVVGLEDGSLKFFENAAIPGKPDSFIHTRKKWFNFLRATGSCVPQLLDVNGDGLLDLLVGEYQGRIFYYQNYGSKRFPLFILEDNFYGKIDARQGSFYGNAVPFFGDIDQDSHYEVLVGNHTGRVLYYDGLETVPPGDAFPLVDSSLFGLDYGQYVTIHGADITDDGKLEFVVGTGRGGLAFFGEKPVGIEDRPHGNALFEALPNPAQTMVYVRWKGVEAMPVASWEVVDITGRRVSKPNIAAAGETIAWNCSNLPRGMYFVRVTWDEGEISLPVVLQ